MWCKKRLDELDGKGSIFNPLWYAGSFAIGAIFGRYGEKVSLGFVEETEKQVVDTFGQASQIKYLQKTKKQLKFFKP